jgi:hypothetical protein
MEVENASNLLYMGVPPFRLGGVAAVVDLERAPLDDVCVATAPVTQRCGLLHLCLSSSLVQRDLASAASWRLPSGGSLVSWGAAVHGEETMVQLLKRVRMHHQQWRSWVSFSSLEVTVGASLAPLFPGETSDVRRPPLTVVPVGVVALVGGIMGASWIR